MAGSGGRSAAAAGVGLATTIVLGLGAGATLTEGAVMVPYWRSLPPEGFLAWYAANATRLFDFFAPLEIAGALLAVVAAVLHVAGRQAGAGQFVVAAALAFAVLVPFPLYFQAVNESFAAATIAPARVPEELARWARWHEVRTAIGLAAFVAAALGLRRHGA